MYVSYIFLFDDEGNFLISPQYIINSNTKCVLTENPMAFESWKISSMLNRGYILISDPPAW